MSYLGHSLRRGSYLSVEKRLVHSAASADREGNQLCFTYLGSSVESTEKDIETRLTKAWTAINRLSTIWKSDLTDKMKRSFFQAAVTSILLYGCTTWTLTKRLERETRWRLHKNAACNPEQVLAATPHKTPTVRPPAPLSRKLFKLDEPDMQDIAGEAEMNS